MKSEYKSEYNIIKMSTQCYSVKWEVGAHLPFRKELYPSLYEAIQRGMYTMQVFLGNPKSFTRQMLTEEDIRACKTLLRRYPLKIFTHFPYIANLAGRSKKGGLAWNCNLSVDRCVRAMMRGLEYELTIVARVGKGVVIHPGSFPDRVLGHETVAKTINKLQFTPGGMLLLENCAGEGNKLCRTFKELGSVLSLVNDENRKHVGVCVDTAHIWGQGDYDLRNVNEVKRLFEDFDKEIGLKDLKLLHLNDSMVLLGSKKDRHAPITMGHIWSELCSLDSLRYLLNRCKELSIPAVLETGDGPCMLTLSQL